MAAGFRQGVGLAALVRDADGLAASAGLASLVAGGEDAARFPAPVTLCRYVGPQGELCEQGQKALVS